MLQKGALRPDRCIPFQRFEATPNQSKSNQRRVRQRIVKSTSKPLEVAVHEPAEAQASSVHASQSLTEQLFSSPNLEGDPRKALKMCEAYWTVSLCSGMHSSFVLQLLIALHCKCARIDPMHLSMPCCITAESLVAQPMEPAIIKKLHCH